MMQVFFYTIVKLIDWNTRMIIPRPKQIIFTNNIYHEWQSYQNVLGVKPTGAGKSIVVSGIVNDGVGLGMHQSIIAHRNELVSQMSIHIAQRGIVHKIVGSDKAIAQITRLHRKTFNRSFLNPKAPTAVIGVDTLIARKDSLKDWARQCDRWIVDEAHHLLRDNKWGKAVEMFPNAKGLGVTATPQRADGQGLGRDYDGVFDTMVLGPEMRELINDGHLADYEIVCPPSDMMKFIENEKTSKDGDWSTQKCKKAAQKSRIVGDVVANYIKYASGKQAICFATDVETAGEIAKKFNNNGVRAVSVSAKTPDAVREKYIEEFKSGIVTILVNVDLFDEGFDVPACEVVIMARPTASLGKYRQMVGRALRTADGKLYGLIIDHVGNVVRHGYPDKIIFWTLARRDKRGSQEKDPDEIPLKPCKGCGKPYEMHELSCPYCGHVPELPAVNSRSIEMVDGDLILLDRAKLQEMRQAMEIEAPGNAASRAPNSMIAKRRMNEQIAKIAARDKLSDVIEQWAGIERAKGLNDRQIHKKFYLTLGVDVLTALDGRRKTKEFEVLIEKVERWYMK